MMFLQNPICAKERREPSHCSSYSGRPGFDLFRRTQFKSHGNEAVSEGGFMQDQDYVAKEDDLIAVVVAKSRFER